jgi:pimeloyl-ACP methyl ester carboxylesterase
MASRRSVIKVAAGAGLIGFAPALAVETTSPTLKEYRAKKGDVSLCLYRKHVAGGMPLFLVHGSSNSALSNFDLAVPGRGEYSMMNVFASKGFDVWTMDHENYGKSSRTAGNSDIASGVEDLKVAAELVATETGAQKFHFYGSSSGALRAGAFAMERPERVGRLVLAAFTWTGKGAHTLEQRAKNIEQYRAGNRRKRDREMIRSIFLRDRPGTSDPAVAEALADAELVYGDETPTGTYLDMVSKLPLVDPERVKAPVLLIRGEHDGIATEEDLLAFYKRLPNHDKQFVILAGAAHSLGLSYARHRLWHVVNSFLTMPPRTES